MQESKKRCINCKLEVNATVKSDGFFFCFSCFDKLLLFGFPEFHRKIRGEIPLELSSWNRLIHSYSIKKASKEDFLSHRSRKSRDKILKREAKRLSVFPP